ncbi:MAG: bifunctional glutamate N-acetyltransferase/amino-acid acetyltransferase ArgJ [Deltaproteobacteria bacterium]|nr:bifunctional glutamate N-acetyltransferase/amino-acid acetyltransferase ArgJ [Deltaproteobacteria bacterium]
MVVPGFRFAGLACGIKASGAADLALIVSDLPASSAGLFTTNLVQAAPVVLSRRRVRSGKCRAIVVNSGNANAATGTQGLADAVATTSCVARSLGLRDSEVLVCSTGVIGRPLPVARLLAGIPAAVGALSERGLEAASEAIMTTDTRPKRASRRVVLPDGRRITIAGFAKGAGMIDPRMATLLAFVVTDAPVPPPALRTLLRAANEESFHRITIDGDRSTNDTALALANGAAGGASLMPGKRGWKELASGFTAVMRELALGVVADAEGWTRTLEVGIAGARNLREALAAARAIAGSLLVKTAVHGADPNWGRILAAAGYSGARFDPARAVVSIGPVRLYDRGRPAGPGPLARVSQLMRARELVPLRVDLAAGTAHTTVWTCDLSAEYVSINADYTT